MGTKIPAATKRLAHQKLGEGLSAKEVAELTGVSLRSVERMIVGLGVNKTAPPPRTANAGTTTSTAPVAPVGRQEEPGTLEFEESPAPVEQKSLVDTALGSLKNMLGISDQEKPKTPKTPLSGKLDAKRTAFVEAVSPTLALAVIAIAGWMWSHQGADYVLLAPDEEVATRIVTPLLRVYARHASFLTDISPDMADVGASLLALVGYVHVSLGLYQQIKQEEYEREQEEFDPQSRRAYRAGGTAAQSESGARRTWRGSAPVQRASNGTAQSNDSHDGHSASVNQLNLSDKEARQYAALSRLSQLDFDHRARRSGQP